MRDNALREPSPKSGEDIQRKKAAALYIAAAFLLITVVSLFNHHLGGMFDTVVQIMDDIHSGFYTQASAGT